MAHDDVSLLREHGINPSAQRVAVASYVLHTDAHPSAEQVFTRVRETFPQVSRATVYNTLNLFVKKGLLRAFVLTVGRVVFDSRVAAHHHLIDEEDGTIHDVAWEALKVSGLDKLEGYAIHEHQVVLRGRRVTPR